MNVYWSLVARSTMVLLRLLQCFPTRFTDGKILLARDEYEVNYFL